MYLFYIILYYILYNILIRLQTKIIKLTASDKHTPKRWSSCTIVELFSKHVIRCCAVPYQIRIIIINYQY